jgi:hypothetical protein
MTAQAVLFADRAELLAQLARDWCTGELETRWWWRELVGRDIDDAVIPAWLAAPEAVPAALEHLSRNGWADRFVAMLEQGAVDALLGALGNTHGLDVVHEVREHWRRLGVSAAGAAPRREPPWRGVVAEASGAGLEPGRELLLGLGLLLWRRPAAVRARGFDTTLRDWSGLTHPDVQQRWRQASGDRSDGSQRRNVAHVVGPVAPHSGPIGTASRVTASRDEPEAPEGFADRAQVATAWSSSPDALDHSTFAGRPAHDARNSDVAQVSATPGAREEPASMTETSVDTAFGGLFFLLNMGISLGLYGDFTMPATPGIALSPWDFLALIGKRLAGSDVEADPVWPLLASLAARPGDQEPGADYVPPEDWRLPPAWLAPFETKTAGDWSATEERLVVEHPAGFRVVDVRLQPGRAASRSRRALRRLLKREMAVYTGAFEPGRNVDPTLANNDGPLARWLDWLVPYLEVRLAETLGIERNGVTDLVLRYRARVFVSSVDVDVVFSLNDLPIAIRLCGLDRDPGWLPAANRVITFHFE